MAQATLTLKSDHFEKRWKDADKFVSKWSAAENRPERYDFACQQFILSSEKCNGDVFAKMEMRLVVPTLLQNIRIGPVLPILPKKRLDL